MRKGGGVTRKQIIVSTATKVYTDPSRDVFHPDLSCIGGAATAWCTAGDAHRSRLSPCQVCAGELQAWLNIEVGRIPSGEKKRRGFPHLNVWHTERVEVRGPEDSVDPLDPELTASRSGDPADPRYANRDERGWGIRAFAQDPDEFMGGPTDDDNDWRGASESYLD
jgi:hypothetical protein